MVTLQWLHVPMCVPCIEAAKVCLCLVCPYCVVSEKDVNIRELGLAIRTKILKIRKPYLSLMNIVYQLNTGITR